MPEVLPIPEAVLEVVAPDGSRRTVPVSQSPFLIGRSVDVGNHLQLPDMRISRQCAALVYADGGFRLEDRGQRTGLYVNGEKIKTRTLGEADTISFGVPDSFQLVFHVGPQKESLPDLLSRMDEAATLESEARDLRHLSLLLEASTLLQTHLPLEAVLGAMVDRAITLTDADRGLLLEMGPGGGWRALLARQRGGLSLPVDAVVPSQTAIAQALEKRRRVLETDVALASADLREARSVVAQQLRSVIAIPLVSLSHLRASDATYMPTTGQVLGVLYLDSRRTAAFTRLEKQILDTLALEAAGVLENTRLAQKERERLRMEQELAAARQIQQALLPKSFRRYPHFQVVGINRPCQAVGGDYFDLMELGPDRAAFVIADVCGKGLGAALLTAMLQGTFSAMTLGHDPACVCQHVNQFICGRSEVQRFATLFFGVLDPTGQLEFINAGHPPPLLVHAGRVEAVFPAGSLPVGLFPETEFQAASARFQPEDTLVLFTDGVSDAVNPQGERFGDERLKDVVARYARAGIDELQSGILTAIEEFSRGAPQADDITVLIVRYQGTQSSGSPTN